MNLATRIPNDLWNAIRNSYEKENFQAAILDSFFLLTELIRQKSGSIADGPRLIGEAFSPNNPKIKITKLETESDKNIQKGYADILRGLYESVRNPRAHGMINDTRENTENIIIFIGYLYNILSESKPFYSVEDFTKRVFDDNFYRSKRYAELLCDEIPSNKLIETVIYLYKNSINYINNRKFHEKLENMNFVFNEIIQRLDENDIIEISNIISKDLSESLDYSLISIIIRIISERLWYNINEISKLRMYNMIEKSIKECYVVANKRSDLINISRYCVHIFQYIDTNTKSNILRFLESYARHKNDKEFILYYLYDILPYIHLLTDKMPQNLSALLAERLDKNEENIYGYIEHVLQIKQRNWPKFLVDAYKKAEDIIPF